MNDNDFQEALRHTPRGATLPPGGTVGLKTMNQRVLFARKRAGLTSTEAANACGISKAAWTGLEKSSSSSRHIFSVADVLGVSARWLATGEGEMLHDSMDFTVVQTVDGLIRLLDTYRPAPRVRLAAAISDCLRLEAEAEESLLALEVLVDELEDEKLDDNTPAYEQENRVGQSFSSGLQIAKPATTIGQKKSKRGKNTGSFGGV